MDHWVQLLAVTQGRNLLGRTLVTYGDCAFARAVIRMRGRCIVVVPDDAEQGKFKKQLDKTKEALTKYVHAKT